MSTEQIWNLEKLISVFKNSRRSLVLIKIYRNIQKVLEFNFLDYLVQNSTPLLNPWWLLANKNQQSFKFGYSADLIEADLGEMIDTPLIIWWPLHVFFPPGSICSWLFVILVGSFNHSIYCAAERYRMESVSTQFLSYEENLL